MRTFNDKKGIYIKSTNSSNKILNRYNYSLILVFMYIIIYHFFWGDKNTITNLLISTSLSVGLSLILQYIINVLKGKKDFKSLFKEDRVLTYSIILGIFLINTPVIISIIILIITGIIKNIFNKMNTTASLFGILFVIIFKYYSHDLNTPLTMINSTNYEGLDNVIKYIIGIDKSCISPLISIIIFGYLFYKKSIKYNLFFSYVTTILLMFLSFSLLNKVIISYPLFELFTGNILFLSVFCLTDFCVTPSSNEGQVIYGILLGIITTILRFIIPNVSAIITMIFGITLFTKIINKISFKLKYNQKFYYILICLEIIAAIISLIILTIIY